ncbi:fimbrial protein [Pseudomonas sp.]|uniref:fimbrial protein n=1 Tax=Pseudomonas sp. TaxID=306 RepID=UPI00262D9449|nr:fimbrial protein [Pseudomonas sp.]
MDNRISTRTTGISLIEFYRQRNINAMNTYLTVKPICAWVPRALTCLSVLLAISLTNSAQANNSCRNSAGTSPGNNMGIFKLNSLQPYYSVPVGGVLGTASFSTTMSCFGVSTTFPFVIQTSPASAPVSGNSICSTPLDGVGVRYRDSIGTPIACNGFKNISYTYSPVPGRIYTPYLGVAAEFIRTKVTTNLPAGAHTLLMPPTTRLLAHLSGVDNSRNWGTLMFDAPIALIVSKCTFAEATTTVDFGLVPRGELDSAAETFDIQISSCGDEAAAREFNNAMSIEFKSSAILPNGTLANKTCSGCAKNLAIAVKTKSGTPVPLNQRYRMASGTFTLDGETIKHHFQAGLTHHGGSVTGGSINTLMTVVLSPI